MFISSHTCFEQWYILPLPAPSPVENTHLKYTTYDFCHTEGGQARIMNPLLWGTGRTPLNLVRAVHRTDND